MRSKTFASIVALVLFSLLFTSPARAWEDDEQGEEYDETARVARVNLVNGEVTLQRADDDTWESARPNVPLVEGDTLATGRDSHAEIQIDARNFARLGPHTVLKITTLRDEGIALSLSEGTITLRLARFDREREYFEVDAPRITLAAESAGLYRIDAEENGEVRITVRDEGRARVYSENSGFLLRSNRTARLFVTGGESEWELSAAPYGDLWDAWVAERERVLTAQLRYDGRERYYDADVWGAEDLDSYGDWSHTREHGYVWRPHVTVINHYRDWAPYRYGHWRWVSPYGWTWVPDENWGWAPYHYGRWVYFNNAWCWAPRGYGYHYGRARWRPALVVFVNLNFGRGDHVAWYPLGPGLRDPRGRYWRRGPDNRGNDRRATRRGGDWDRRVRSNPALLRAVTSLPTREFGITNVRSRPVSGEWARRALDTEPFSGRLPIVPARRGGMRGEGRETRAAGGQPRDGEGRGRLVIVNPETVRPPRTIPDRRTGADARRPGIALDEQLRRSRIFSNREPRAATPNPGGGANRNDGDEGAGAYRRPARTPRTSQPDTGGIGNENRGPEPRTRPTRPDSTGGGRPDNPETEPAPRVRRPDRDDGDNETWRRRERPTRTLPERPDAPRPERTEPRRERPSQPEERERTQPPRREERPPRSDRPVEQRPPTRTEPSPRRETPREETPRQQPPREEAPRPRPREEAPRQSPPREEAPRQPQPRQEAPPRQDRPAPPRVVAPAERPPTRERPVESPQRERPVDQERDQRRERDD